RQVSAKPPLSVTNATASCPGQPSPGPAAAGSIAPSKTSTWPSGPGFATVPWMLTGPPAVTTALLAARETVGCGSGVTNTTTRIVLKSVWVAVQDSPTLTMCSASYATRGFPAASSASEDR